LNKSDFVLFKWERHDQHEKKEYREYYNHCPHLSLKNHSHRRYAQRKWHVQGTLSAQQLSTTASDSGV
jgi:hypothetical protein